MPRRRASRPSYQELDVIDELTVAQNVMLGREVRRGPFLDDRASARLAAAALARAGSTVDTQAYPRDLSLAQQQRIVIRPLSARRSARADPR